LILLSTFALALASGATQLGFVFLFFFNLPMFPVIGEMDESQTVTNVQVSNHIPDDITISILSKLPLKSFKRFECVRKSWSLLFDDPYFMTIYRNNFLSKNCSYYDDTYLFVGLTEDGYEYNPSRGSNLIGLYSLSGENFENIVKIDWPKPFEDEDLDMDSDWDWDSDSSVDEDDTIFRIMDLTSVNGFLSQHFPPWQLETYIVEPNY
jgi:hypothetical protein